MTNVPLIVLLPAYNPTDDLVDFVRKLSESEFAAVVVVDDGSVKASGRIFHEISRIQKVVLLQHAVNLGKGAALKTGFNHILVHYPDAKSIIVADADGQHDIDDIWKVAHSAAENPEKFVLGVRMFGKEVPLRSLMGNQITRAVMRLFTGLKLSDTQTGLRAWPRKLCITSLKITINGYDFEMESLIQAQRQGIRFVEIPIQTIYKGGNKSSHFNPLFDSMKIYFVFVRYCSASLAAVIVDYLFFITAFLFSEKIGLSMIIGRAFAFVVSFYLNRNIVFRAHKDKWFSFTKFLLVITIFGIVSFFGITYLNAQWQFGVIAAKVLIEFLLFFVGFAVMNLLVFNREADSNEVPVATDWDAYYSHPFKASAYTRKVTGRVLYRLLKQFSPVRENGLSIGELGGGDSCFFEGVKKWLKPVQYYIIDNNKMALEKFCKRAGDDKTIVICNENVLDMKERLTLDIVFSIGLIEHFPEEKLKQVIAAHFRLLKPDGIAIISFPTPTFLYRATRYLAEICNLWVFHDERPLRREEVADALKDCGDVLYEKNIWPIFLTQRIMVIKNNPDFSKASAV